MYLSNIYLSVSIVFGSLTERSPLEADIASTLSPSEADMMMFASRISPSETEVRFRMNNGGLDEVTAMNVIVFVSLIDRSPLEADIASTLSPSEADLIMLASRLSPSETEV